MSGMVPAEADVRGLIRLGVACVLHSDAGQWRGNTLRTEYKHFSRLSPMPAPRNNDFAAGNPGGGAPESNTNARKHSLYMREDDYIERQSDDDQTWIYELTESLVDMWRKRHGDKPPKAIRNRLESIAIDMHRVAWANSYFADEGLTQIRQEVVGDETITAEKLNLWASEIRHYNDSIEKRLDKHGLLDPPEDRGTPEAGTVLESEDYVITFEDVEDD